MRILIYPVWNNLYYLFEVLLRTTEMTLDESMLFLLLRGTIQEWRNLVTNQSKINSNPKGTTIRVQKNNYTGTKEKLQVEDLHDIKVIVVAIEKIRMGERVPGTCMHYDIRSRYLTTGVKNQATFIQDVGRCAGHKNNAAKVYVGVDGRISGNVKSIHNLLRGGLLSDTFEQKEHPEYVENCGVYSALKSRLVILNAAPQIGKTGAVLSTMGILAEFFTKPRNFSQ